MKRLLLLSLFPVFASSLSVGQSTWLPQDDYRLYNNTSQNDRASKGCYGVKYELISSSTDSIVYRNYVQFRDFPAFIIQPDSVYTMADPATLFGDHCYYPQKDEVTLFALGLRMPNHPVANQTWTCLPVYKGKYHIEASSGSWSYDPAHKDSVLVITCTVFNDTNKTMFGDVNNGSRLIYGRTTGLLGFSSDLITGAQGEYSELLYSSSMGIGNLPGDIKDVFSYEDDMEIHSVRVITNGPNIDSVFNIRKMIAVSLIGNQLYTLDSIKTATMIFRQGPVILEHHGIINRSIHTTYTKTDLAEYQFFITNGSQTAVRSMDSVTNQEFIVVKSNSPVSSFELLVGDTMEYDSSFQPMPPYAYVSQYGSVPLTLEHQAFYLGAGGPYRRFIGIEHTDNEHVVFVSNSFGQKGTPLDFSFINSIKPIEKIQVSLFPNPATDHITIILDKAGSWEATVYDLGGKKMESFRIEGNQAGWTCCGYANGVYLLRLVSETGVASARVIIAE